jgi:hypothetical protein
MRFPLMLTWICLSMSSNCTVTHEYLGSIPEPGARSGSGPGLIITIIPGAAGNHAQPKTTAGVSGTEEAGPAYGTGGVAGLAGGAGSAVAGVDGNSGTGGDAASATGAGTGGVGS